MLAAIAHFFRAKTLYAQSLNELSRLGDRELEDIGICRSEIRQVAWDAAQRA